MHRVKTSKRHVYCRQHLAHRSSKTWGKDQGLNAHGRTCKGLACKNVRGVSPLTHSCEDGQYRKVHASYEHRCPGLGASSTRPGERQSEEMQERRFFHLARRQAERDGCNQRGRVPGHMKLMPRFDNSHRQGLWITMDGKITREARKCAGGNRIGKSAIIAVQNEMLENKEQNGLQQDNCHRHILRVK